MWKSFGKVKPDSDFMSMYLGIITGFFKITF